MKHVGGSLWTQKTIALAHLVVSVVACGGKTQLEIGDDTCAGAPAGECCDRDTPCLSGYSCEANECVAVSGAAGGPGSLDPQAGNGTDTEALTVPEAFADKLVESNPEADKVDLLFVVDNSYSMADKQTILGSAVADLVRSLVAPPCIDAAGHFATAVGQTANGCPIGFQPAFAPVEDIHVGVITSSLGDFGATNSPCTSTSSFDRAHLLGSLTRGSTAIATSAFAAPEGFLAYRNGQAPVDLFTNDVQRLIDAAGEHGCGFESSQEAWYRFLGDPAPYADLVRVTCPGDDPSRTDCVTTSGVDQTILSQRAAFLRPDSLIAVIVVTDENDCSLRVGGQAWFAADNGNSTRMFRAASICQTDPNDPCCYSCGVDAPAGCTPDPVCASRFLDDVEDPVNLRCFQQKRRFGLDFLFPINRYVNAVSRPDLCLDRADLDSEHCTDPSRLVPNPIFAVTSRPELRFPGKVILGTIAGVPWQDLQKTADSQGVAYPTEELHFMTGQELQTAGRFAAISWEGNSPPSDPFMVESIDPRTGQNPFTGDSLSPTNSPVTWGNAINGHEWTVSVRDDLQYSCIFPLPVPRDCSAAGGDTSCDCDAQAVSYDYRPLCQDPTTGTYSSIQYAAKAYPGIRHFDILQEVSRRLGKTVPGSICARNLSDPSAQDYGYRPFATNWLRLAQENLVK